jgi:hypothetical protein
MQQKMQYRECENSCRDIIEHNSGTFWESLQLPHWRRLDDVERSKKYKTREKSFPCEWDGDQRDQLACNLVDDNELRILHGCRACHTGRGRNTDERYQSGEGDGNRGAQGRRKFVCNSRPDYDRDSRRPRARAWTQATDAKESCYLRRPKRSAGTIFRGRHRHCRGNLRSVHDSSSASSGLLSRIDSSASAVGDEMT